MRLPACRMPWGGIRQRSPRESVTKAWWTFNPHFMFAFRQNAKMRSPTTKLSRLTHRDVILTTTDSHTADKATQEDKIMLAKLGRWVPIVYNHDIKLRKKLTETLHEEITGEMIDLLNQDWLEYPQMRYCTSQLLAGAIIIEGPTAPC
ncbi:hypothetical protein J3Q64DRAFT_1704753 [Phycomyces blakesleeanus]|uniref:Uncharacterized protein n=1 Tax=Phycomyces blakesleeanus TaxID=4837 RepID=A0ABR3AGA3_PHYBL